MIDEVTTRNTTAYFFGPLCILLICYVWLTLVLVPSHITSQSRVSIRK